MSDPTILIVRFSAIGDCVMDAWAVSALRLEFPAAHIIWAVQDRCVPALDQGTLVDEIVEIPRSRWKDRGPSLKNLKEQHSFYRSLSAQNIDFGFDFQGHSKTALFLKMAGCAVRRAATATDLFARSLNPVMQNSPLGPHMVQRSIALLQSEFDVQLPDKPFMPSVEDNLPDDELACSQRPLVTIQTGAGEEDKRYPAELWAKVAEELRSSDFDLVAIGAPGDPTIDHPAVVNRVGAWTLGESIAMVGRSQLHLAADTGTGHVASAYGHPVVSVFGRTDPAVFRPWGEHVIALREGQTPSSTKPESIADAAKSLMEAKHEVCC